MPPTASGSKYGFSTLAKLAVGIVLVFTVVTMFTAPSLPYLIKGVQSTRLKLLFAQSEANKGETERRLPVIKTGPKLNGAAAAPESVSKGAVAAPEPAPRAVWSDGGDVNMWDTGDGKLLVDSVRMEKQVGKCAENVALASNKPRWPLYKVTEHEALSKKDLKNAASLWPLLPDKRYDWGKGEGLKDKAFQKTKFYLYDDGVFDMRAAEQCYSRIFKLPPPTQEGWWDQIDNVLSIVNREYYPDFRALPALRAHRQRTMDPAEADLFVIGFSGSMLVHSYHCDEVADMVLKKLGMSGNVTTFDYAEHWQVLVGQALLDSKWFQRYSGRDHIHMHTWYRFAMSEKLKKVLDSGPIVLTVERYLNMMAGEFPWAYTHNQVIIIPYVSSTTSDDDRNDRIVPAHELFAQTNNKTWWFFRGNMARRFAGVSRAKLPDLGKLLGKASFEDAKVNMKNRRNVNPGAILVSDREMRKSAVCLAPEGDSPTSLRLFEALAVGCLPVVMAPKKYMTHVLPFPNLIDWDSIALFTEGLDELTQKCQHGLPDLADTLNAVIGPGTGQELASKMHRMRLEGRRIFRRHFSFMRNPNGYVTSFLYEGWRHLQATPYKDASKWTSAGPP